MDKTNKKYIFLIILSGILSLIPIGTLILEQIESINPEIVFDTNVYLFINYIIKLIGILLFFLVLKKTDLSNKSKFVMMKKLCKFALIILVISFILSYYCEIMLYKRIDGIILAIILTFLSEGCLYIFYFLIIILLIDFF